MPLSDSPYKIHSRIGISEFTAEGPEASVREDYSRWLDALKAPQPQPQSPNPGLHPSLLPATSMGNTPLPLATAHLATMPKEHAERTFRDEGELLSLRHLPPTTNKVADGAIVLLFGYQMLKGMQEVPVIRLNESLRRSGLNVTRLDRELSVYQSLFRKGGQKSGGRYSLNNQGVQQAERWIAEWQ